MNLQKEWDRFKYLSFFFFIIVFPVSCSTKPQYSIQKIYKNGNTDCVKQCRDEKKVCEISCEKQYENCIRDAYKRAKEIFSIKLDDYKILYDQYSHLYDRYLEEYNRWFFRFNAVYDIYRYYADKCNKDKKDRYSCSKARYFNSEVENFRLLKPSPPKAPSKPDFSKILENEKKSCNKDCSCDENFDICFVSCGGKIDIRKICIKNCVTKN